jgi:haloalkane dehalogenase
MALALQGSLLVRHAPAAVAAAGWHAVAPDLPGHGDSPLEPHDGTWHGHIRALDDLVTHRGWVPEALVLHDWGGLIGLRWALDAGLRPRALVLSGRASSPTGAGTAWPRPCAARWASARC